MKYQIICTINDEFTQVSTKKEVKKFIKNDLKYWNQYEIKTPYNEDDYIINKITKNKKKKL